MSRRAQEFFRGDVGDFTKKFSGDREELVIINDGTGELTFTAGATNFTMKAGEVFDEEINPFSSIQVTAAGPFRGFVREASN
jgi:hypothetical protein